MERKAARDQSNLSIDAGKFVEAFGREIAMEIWTPSFRRLGAPIGTLSRSSDR
jgi:hypothetical protein